MIGTWTLNDEDERDSLAYLIRCLPCDGRYEVVIREASATADNQPKRHDDGGELK